MFLRSASMFFKVLFLLPVTALSEDQKDGIVYGHGFDTAGPARRFPVLWRSLKDRHKLQGKVSEHLSRDQIDRIVILELNIAVRDPSSATLQKHVLSFLFAGNRFQTGLLPKAFVDNSHKRVVGLFRTKKGDYGLITVFRDITVVELKGRIGVAPTREKRAGK